jgi:hypothetical protein
MKIAGQQEDLQLLAEILQERLITEVPSGQAFQLRCAIQNEELMILVQHEQGVIVNTEQIFTVIEEGLQWQFHYQGQQAKCFLRVVGDKLPYAKQSLTLHPHTQEQDNFTDLSGDYEHLILPPDDLPNFSIPLAESPVADAAPISEPEQFNYPEGSLEPAIVYNPFSTESETEPEEEEKFDPFADAPDLLEKKKKFTLPSISVPVLVGGVVGIAVIAGGVGYFLTRGCVISECKELQNATQAKTEFPPLLRKAKSEQQLQAVQQQIDDTVTSLKNIPEWSPRNPEVQELISNFSAQSAKIDQVLQALKAAKVATRKSQTSAQSLDELRSIQALWRKAIAPLESIKPKSELYRLAQEKLPSYQRSLEAINRQLIQEQAWLRKLDNARVVANTASKLEAAAKTANDWQRVETTWQVSVDALKSIPQNSPGYQEARNLLVQYQPKLTAARNRANKEMLAAKAYQAAISSANQARTYGNQNQWQASVNSWQQALQNAQQIPQDSWYYKQGQSLTAPYSASLEQAQEKLQLANNVSQTRADLSSTCTNGIQFCTFTIDSTGIRVRLTLQYQQVLQGNNPEMKNHYQTLQSALVVISDNSKLPLVLYDSQGKELYLHNPGV